ncbi:MAG: CoA-binding protein [Actinomycetia bacterium]|nr:CoA-binding protein [Actinomycetes bacterium]
MRDAIQILRDSKTIAVVGLSRAARKAAHHVPASLQALGFRIIPVNPEADEILGETVYRRLADIPDPVDVVEVFRPAPEAAAVAREAAALGIGAIWLQLGIRSAEAAAIAAEAGMDYVEDRCMIVDARQAGIRH